MRQRANGHATGTLRCWRLLPALSLAFAACLDVPVELPAGDRLTIDAADLDETTLAALDGTQVALSGSFTLVDTSALERFGQVTVVAGLRRMATTPPRASVEMVVDDHHDDEWAWPPMLFPRAPHPRLGATTGTLAGRLERRDDGYRLVATDAPAWHHPERPAPPSPPGDAMVVASLNLQNRFTTLGRRGARSPKELERQRRKLVSALSALDADVLALTELENDARALADLLEALNLEVGRAGGYAASQVEPPAGAELRSALLYRRGAVVPLDEARFDEDASFARPPLVQRLNARGREATFVVAHLRSKRCTQVEASSEDCGAEQRLREAGALATLARRRTNAGLSVLVLGDFNAFPHEPALEPLAAAGLDNLISRVPWPGRYSYAYRGQAGLLDHAWASEDLADALLEARVWHCNADESPTLGYRSEHAPLADRFSAFRSSDHDPIWVALRNPPPR